MNLIYFKKEYPNRLFFLVLIAVVTALHFFAFLINYMDFHYSQNDILLEKQMEKIGSSQATIKTIIVGDSSAGNAIDAEFFGELSGSETLNLSVTATYGIISSLNIAKQARLQHPEIKNVIIVQALNIWDRPFSREGFYKTESNINTDDIGSDFFSTYKWIDRIEYKLGYRWLRRFTKYSLGTRPETVISNDYIKQDNETYRNGKLREPEEGLPVKNIKPRKKDVFLIFDDYCAEMELNCVFIHGPIHENIYINTDEEYFEQIFNVIDSSKTIYSSHTVFSIPNENMGDSQSHIDITHKPEMTQRYYQEIREYIE